MVLTEPQNNAVWRMITMVEAASLWTSERAAAMTLRSTVPRVQFSNHAAALWWVQKLLDLLSMITNKQKTYSANKDKITNNKHIFKKVRN